MPDDYSYKVVLVDYDDDLFAPRGTEEVVLASVGASWIAAQHRTPEAILAAAADADVVMIQSVRPLLQGPVIDGLERCRAIIRVGIGYDSVDVAAATERGILVCNVPDYCAEEVSDHAISLLLGAARHLARQDRSIRSGQWDRTLAKPAQRLRGRTLGLLGFGRTARGVALKVRGFQFNLLAHDPYIDQEVFQTYGVKPVDLVELLRSSDFLSVHVPLMESTYHLLGAKELAMMPQGAVLVNTARGPVVDQRALTIALCEGPLAAAGLDVLEWEPPESDDPLLKLDNVILTPHTAGYSEQSVADLYRLACQTAVEVLEGRLPSTVVNPTAVKRAQARWKFED